MLRTFLGEDVPRRAPRVRAARRPRSGRTGIATLHPPGIVLSRRLSKSLEHGCLDADWPVRAASAVGEMGVVLHARAGGRTSGSRRTRGCSLPRRHPGPEDSGRIVAVGGSSRGAERRRKDAAGPVDGARRHSRPVDAPVEDPARPTRSRSRGPRRASRPRMVRRCSRGIDAPPAPTTSFAISGATTRYPASTACNGGRCCPHCSVRSSAQISPHVVRRWTRVLR
jgi:hypothetical protein